VDKKLNDNAWVNLCENVELICTPLFAQTPIGVMQYQRIYPDGSRTILSNHSELMLHRYARADAKIKQLYTPMLRKEFERYSLTGPWSASLEDKILSRRITSQLQEERSLFNVGHEFCILEQTETYEQSFLFWRLDQVSDGSNFYVNNIKIMEEFRSCFLDKAINLIDIADRNRLVQPWREIYSNQVYIDEVDNYITKKELGYMLQLSQGKNDLESANNWSLRPDNLNKHLESLCTGPEKPDKL